MGDLAASGGYYIACNADKIYAQPTTLTGSIGVFGVIPNVQTTFKEHLGITFDVAKTNHHFHPIELYIFAPAAAVRMFMIRPRTRKISRRENLPVANAAALFLCWYYTG